MISYRKWTTYDKKIYREWSGVFLFWYIPLYLSTNTYDRS